MNWKGTWQHNTTSFLARTESCSTHGFLAPRANIVIRFPHWVQIAQVAADPTRWKYLTVTLVNKATGPRRLFHKPPRPHAHVHGLVRVARTRRTHTCARTRTSPCRPDAAHAHIRTYTTSPCPPGKAHVRTHAHAHGLVLSPGYTRHAHMHTYTARTHSQTSTQVVPYASFSSGRKLSTSTWCGQRPSSSNAWASRAQMNYAQASMERADGKGRVIRRCDAIQSAPFEPVGARMIVIAHATRAPQASHVDVLDRHQTYKGKPTASHTTCSEVLPGSMPS